MIKLDLLSIISAGTEFGVQLPGYDHKETHYFPRLAERWFWWPNSASMENRERIENASSQIPGGEIHFKHNMACSAWLQLQRSSLLQAACRQHTNPFGADVSIELCANCKLRQTTAVLI